MIPVSQIVAAPAVASATNKQAANTEPKSSVKKSEDLSLEDLVRQETGEPTKAEILSQETQANIPPQEITDEDRQLFVQADTAYKESNIRVDLQFLPDQLRQQMEELPSSLYV